MLDSWDDLYRDDGSVDMERLTREADPLSVTTEPYQECPEVDVKVTLYEVFLLEDGVEVEDSIMSHKVIDIKNQTGTIQNEEHPWIRAPVMLRSVELSGTFHFITISSHFQAISQLFSAGMEYIS